MVLGLKVAIPHIASVTAHTQAVASHAVAATLHMTVATACTKDKTAYKTAVVSHTETTTAHIEHPASLAVATTTLTVAATACMVTAVAHTTAAKAIMHPFETTTLNRRQNGASIFIPNKICLVRDMWRQNRDKT